MPKRKRTEAARQGWKKRKEEQDVVKERRKSRSSCVSPRKRRKLWDNQSMVMAIEAVKEGRMGVNHAAKEHGVPRTTLKDRLSGRVEHGKKPGPIPYFNSNEEDELATFLKEASRIGYGKTKREVLLIVQKTLEQKGNKPEHFNGEGWYHRFMQRHPTLSLRSADPLSYVRTIALTPEKLNSYFDLLETTLREKELLNKPNLIYNMDESGMHSQCVQLADQELLACCVCGSVFQ